MESNEQMLSRETTEVILGLLPKFTDIAEKPPEDKKITVYCGDEGVVIDVYWKDVGILKLVAQSWILHEGIKNKMENKNGN